MKNKDLPAMPLTGDAYTDLAGHLNKGQGFEPECLGLTKREYFAAHAPDMHEWYRIQNRSQILNPEDVLSDAELADYKEYQGDNYGYERYEEGEAASARYSEEWFKHDCKESMRVFTEWRWHYADMMLESEK